MNIENSRLHYMDNLRAIIMILGVFFHAALAYSPALHSIWFSADQVNSPLMDHFVSFFHLFRMPLFFAIAGFFTALLVTRRGTGGMLKNRSGRILLPFAIFWPLVTAGIVVSIGWALANVQNPSPLLQMITQMQQLPDAPKPPITTAHLWFLYYLMFFYVLVWVFRALVPEYLGQKILSLHPALAILLLPLLLLPGLMMARLPFPAPESFLPQLWALLFFGGFFAGGYLLYRSFRLVDFFNKTWPLLIAGSLLLFGLFQAMVPEQTGFDYVAPAWPQRILLMLCTAFISVWMSVAGLAFAKKCLDLRNGFMRLLSDASYWIYIVHLPVVLAVQYWLLDQTGGVVYKYSISVAATLAISFISYLVLVRWTPIGWMLNGRKKQPPRTDIAMAEMST